jgi:hypothetical protein
MHAGNETIERTPKRLLFFFFSVGGERRMDLKKFLCFHHVTSMSSYFPKVLNVFLKDPSNNTSLYPISFAQMSFPLLTYI